MNVSPAHSAPKTTRPPGEPAVIRRRSASPCWERAGRRRSRSRMLRLGARGWGGHDRSRRGLGRETGAGEGGSTRAVSRGRGFAGGGAGGATCRELSALTRRRRAVDGFTGSGLARLGLQRRRGGLGESECGGSRSRRRRPAARDRRSGFRLVPGASSGERLPAHPRPPAGRFGPVSLPDYPSSRMTDSRPISFRPPSRVK